MKKYILLLIGLIGIFCSCQPKDKFSWNAGISAPKNYPSGAPFVEFFYRGKSLGGASSSTGADQGWGVTSGGYVGGEKFKAVPDSVSLRWVCSVDNLVYQKGFRLPREKMLSLFREGVTDVDGRKYPYTLIVAGMAPGGNVTIWMQGGGINTEIEKFKITNGFEDPQIDYEYKEKDIKYWSEYLSYWLIHGIPYSVWEKEEKQYNYDIGFVDVQDKKFYINIVPLAKDGSYIFFNKSTDVKLFKRWLLNHVSENLKQEKIPTHLTIQWISRDNQQWYEGEVVLPINFEERFVDFNFRNEITNFIVLMDELDTNLKYAFGSIWLQSKTEKQEIMKFRLAKLNIESREYDESKYSLPKGFVFPKWEGREKLTFPEIEFWQEP